MFTPPKKKGVIIGFDASQSKIQFFWHPLPQIPPTSLPGLLVMVPQIPQAAWHQPRCGPDLRRTPFYCRSWRLIGPKKWWRNVKCHQNWLGYHLQVFFDRFEDPVERMSLHPNFQNEDPVCWQVELPDLKSRNVGSHLHGASLVLWIILAILSRVPKKQAESHMWAKIHLA